MQAVVDIRILECTPADSSGIAACHRWPALRGRVAGLLALLKRDLADRMQACADVRFQVFGDVLIVQQVGQHRVHAAAGCFDGGLVLRRQEQQQSQCRGIGDRVGGVGGDIDTRIRHDGGFRQVWLSGWDVSGPRTVPEQAEATSGFSGGNGSMVSPAAFKRWSGAG